MYLVVIAVGQRVDELRGLRGTGGALDLILRNAAAQIDVLPDGAGKERVGLKRHAELLVQRRAVHGRHVLTVDVNSAGIRPIKPLQQLNQRGLAAAGGADHAQRLAPVQGEGHMIQIVLAAIIGEANVVEHDVRIGRQRTPVGRRLLVGQRQHLVDAVGRRHRLRQHHEHLVDGQHRVEDDRKIGKKGDDRARLGGAALHQKRARHHHRGQSAVE